MGKNPDLGKWVIALSSGLLLVCLPLLAATPPSPPGLAVSGLEVRVIDVEQAAGFFELFGFEVSARGNGSATLRNGAAVIDLQPVSRKADTDDPARVETHINLRVPDLGAAVTDFKKRGYTFVRETPQEAPVGLFSILKDASGNVFHLLEPRPKPASGVTPGIFNVGIRVTDMAQAREFYCDKLGFEIFSEEFLPSLPLKKKGTVSLVLHENATARVPVDLATARTIVVLETADVGAAAARLKAQGITFLTKGSDRTAFADPFGNVLELRKAGTAR